MTDFQKLYEQYADRVYHYLLGLSGDARQAEELTQETFFRALKGIEKFRGDSSLYTWLCKIGKNLYLGEVKKQKRFLKTDRTHPVLEGTEEFPLHTLLDRETALAVHKALHMLADPYREVFSLRIFGELKFQEIAEVCGKSENWAKVTFFRAKEKIIRKMEANGWL